MFTKWRLSCRVQCKNCEGGFSFLSLHLGSKYTFEGLTNEQEMCSRILEWKEMGLKSQKGLCLQDTLEDDQPLQSCKNYNALYELFGVNALWSGEKGLLSRSPTVFHF